MNKQERMLKLNFNNKKFIIVIIALMFNIVLSVNILSADTINKYKIKLDVQEDGIINVQQEIDINFTQPRHGIYVNIPSTYHMKWSETDKRDYFFPIRKINVLKYKYSVDYSLEGVQIKIGDGNKYLTGNNIFKYNYQIKTRDAELEDYQILYFNLVGNGWQHLIKQVDFEINMPKDFKNKPLFFGGNESLDLKYNIISDRYIKGELKSPLKSGQAFTINLKLPSNYFKYEKNDNSQIVGLIAYSFLIIISFTIYLKFGRDREYIHVLEFKAPDNLSSAQVGYILDQHLSFKELSSLFIYWASKGYLSIKEIDEKNTFEFSKVKDIDTQEMNFERSLFNALFKDQNTVQSNNLPKNFFDMAVFANKDYSDYFKKDNAIFEKKGIVLKYTLLTLITLLFSIFSAITVFNYYEMFIQPLIVFIISFISLFIIGFGYTRVVSNFYIQKLSKKVISIIMIILGYTVYAILLVIFSYVINASISLSLISLVIYIANISILTFMSKRTVKGHKLYEQILGLRDFISYAEKDRLELLVEENPEFFYNILPYSYVLNVSDKWVKKFEHIKMKNPDWYQSNSTFVSNYLVLVALNNSMSSLGTSITTNVTSGVGGFTGGSGGGFSGGGFGGGGGGSW